MSRAPCLPEAPSTQPMWTLVPKLSTVCVVGTRDLSTWTFWGQTGAARSEVVTQPLLAARDLGAGFQPCWFFLCWRPKKSPANDAVLQAEDVQSSMEVSLRIQHGWKPLPKGLHGLSEGLWSIYLIGVRIGYGTWPENVNNLFPKLRLATTFDNLSGSPELEVKM